MPWVLTGSRDASIKVWSTRSWRCVRTMSAPGVRCLNLISAERLLLVGLDSGEIQWWKQGRDSELLAPLAAPPPKPRMNLAWEDELAIVCIHIHIHIHILMYIHVCVHIHIPMRMHIYIMYICIHISFISKPRMNLAWKGALMFQICVKVHMCVCTCI